VSDAGLAAQAESRWADRESVTGPIPLAHWEYQSQARSFSLVMQAVVNLLLAVACGAAVLVGLVCVVGNFVMLLLSLRSQRRGTPKFYSLVPFVGPTALTIFWLTLTTVPGTLPWFILTSWLIDPATWMLILAAAQSIRLTSRRSPFTRALLLAASAVAIIMSLAIVFVDVRHGPPPDPGIRPSRLAARRLLALASAYKAEHHACPVSFTTEHKILDAWGTRFDLHCEQTATWVRSAGPDRRFDTEDDLQW
jgi:hypothetical protein